MITAYDEFQDHIEALRKRGVPEAQVYLQAHQENLGLYKRYLQEQRHGVVSERERKADAAAERTAKALERPTIPTPFGPFGRILNELVAHEITQKRAKSPAEAIMAIRFQYPEVVGRADAEAWDYAAGRGE